MLPVWEKGLQRGQGLTVGGRSGTAKGSQRREVHHIQMGGDSGKL